MSSAFYGLETLATRLRDAGFASRPAPHDTVAGTDRGFLSQDRHVLVVDGAPVDFVTARIAGTTGLRQGLTAGQFTSSIGPIPIASRSIWPMQVHWVLRGHFPESISARLHQKTRGFLRRERVAMEWTGGSLARKLQGDTKLNETLAFHLALDDRLEIRWTPQQARIVHQQSQRVTTGLLVQDFVHVDRDELPAAVVGVILRIAALIRIHPDDLSRPGKTPS